MAKDKNIEVTIVVSGQPEHLKVNVHQTLEHLVHEALQRSGNHGQSPAAWELRTEAGVLLDQDQGVESVLRDGDTVFLSPKAGAGG